MSPLKVGYARVSTDEQDLTAQRDGLAAFGVDPKRIYVDHGLTARAATPTVRACGRRWLPVGTAIRSWSPSSIGWRVQSVMPTRSPTTSRRGK
ncbi:recombinase family protein [Propioniferax innocua]|nr:recombinase family protein [Propioniferax innocua]